MKAIEVLKKRRSIRKYEDKAIPEKVLEQLVDAARYAPTARNIQPWEFIIITSQQVLKKISGFAENGRFVAGAKACIAVFCADTKYYLEDGCAATQNILLAATALGLGSCWVAGDKKTYCGQVSSLLNVPVSYKLVSLVALGYPEPLDSPSAVDKKILSEIIHWEKF